MAAAVIVLAVAIAAFTAVTRGCWRSSNATDKDWSVTYGLFAFEAVFATAFYGGGWRWSMLGLALGLFYGAPLAMFVGVILESRVPRSRTARAPRVWIISVTAILGQFALLCLVAGLFSLAAGSIACLGAAWGVQHLDSTGYFDRHVERLSLTLVAMVPFVQTVVLAGWPTTTSTSVPRMSSGYAADVLTRVPAFELLVAACLPLSIVAARRGWESFETRYAAAALAPFLAVIAVLIAWPVSRMPPVVTIWLAYAVLTTALMALLAHVMAWARREPAA
jgi:hypothetical protein